MGTVGTASDSPSESQNQAPSSVPTVVGIPPGIASACQKLGCASSYKVHNQTRDRRAEFLTGRDRPKRVTRGQVRLLTLPQEDEQLVRRAADAIRRRAEACSTGSSARATRHGQDPRCADLAAVRAPRWSSMRGSRATRLRNPCGRFAHDWRPGVTALVDYGPGMSKNALKQTQRVGPGNAVISPTPVSGCSPSATGGRWWCRSVDRVGGGDLRYHRERFDSPPSEAAVAQGSVRTSTGRRG